MTSYFGGRTTRASARSRARSARGVLAALMTSVGETGLAAAARDPGLLALVDQHAAAVRDSLSGSADFPDGPVDSVEDLLRHGRRPLSAVALAGYAEGVRDAAREHGWQPPLGVVDWSAPDWVLVRLLAVCAVAGHIRLGS